MRPQAPLAKTKQNWDYFLKLPELDRRTSSVEHPPAAVQQPCSSSLARALAAGDSLYQAGNAALRRPLDYRQCDWLLVDLRRQPADNALYL